MTDRALRLVDGGVLDTGTGELTDGCPNCSRLGDEILGLQHTIRSLAAKNTQLKRDDEKKARESAAWPRAVAVFRYWQMRTEHPGSEFSVDRFHMVEPFLRPSKTVTVEDREEECRRAIDGILLSEWHRVRGIDGFDKIFGTRDKFEGFKKLMPPREQTIRSVTLREHAAEVASRVLERAKLIDEADAVACGHLLIEIQRLIRGWQFVPEEPDRPVDDDGQTKLIG